LCMPLERGLRFGDERGEADIKLEIFAVIFPPKFDGLVCQIDDALKVLVSLCWQAAHEIELERAPAPLQHLFNGFVEALLVHRLINHLAQSWCACFRCEGEAALAHAADFACE